MNRSLTISAFSFFILTATGAMAETPSAADRDPVKKEEGIGKLAHALAQKFGDKPQLCAKRKAAANEEVFQFNLYGAKLNCFKSDGTMHPLMTLRELREANFVIKLVGAEHPGFYLTKIGGRPLLFYTPFLPEGDDIKTLMDSPALLMGREINAAYVRALNLAIEAAHKNKKEEILQNLKREGRNMGYAQEKK